MAAPKGFRSWQNWFDRHIAECENCAPYFQGEGQMSAEGSEADLDEVPVSIDVPERLAERVIANGTCDGCKSSLDGQTKVWVRSSEEVEFLRDVERATEKHGPRLREFNAYLEKHPSLGAGHAVGRALVRAVRGLAPISVGGYWYRCIREREQDHAVSCEDFRAPSGEQKRPISEGRFNHAGQAHWYLANNAMTSVSEVLDDEAGVVFVQKFSVRRCKKVLDLHLSFDRREWPAAVRNDGVALALVMLGQIDVSVDRKRAWKPGYLLPRFVMDAAKDAGFQGIVYGSARTIYGKNLVLFDREWPARCVGKPKRIVQEAPPADGGVMF
jgi:hypothetical protein